MITSFTIFTAFFQYNSFGHFLPSPRTFPAGLDLNPKILSVYESDIFSKPGLHDSTREGVVTEDEDHPTNADGQP